MTNTLNFKSLSLLYTITTNLIYCPRNVDKTQLKTVPWPSQCKNSWQCESDSAYWYPQYEQCKYQHTVLWYKILYIPVQFLWKWHRGTSYFDVRAFSRYHFPRVLVHRLFSTLFFSTNFLCMAAITKINHTHSINKSRFLCLRTNSTDKKIVNPRFRKKRAPLSLRRDYNYVRIKCACIQ